MDYIRDDIKMIAELLCGKRQTSIPKSLCFTETDTYEFCFEYKIDTTILDEAKYSIEILTAFLCNLANNDKLLLFIGYYFNKFLEERNTEIAENGYNLFALKEKLIIEINTVWSIPEQEFSIDNSGCTVKHVQFTLYNKMGQGGFCTVFKCPSDNSRVFKVLNNIEKTDVGSVHRFKREYEIMQRQNNSGYTIRVYDYDSENLVYAMDKAKFSLEDYIAGRYLSDDEKDDIVFRITDSMRYLHSQKVIHRDFHPGNILQMNDGTWLVTDFGLAKELSIKYSRQTTTTHAVGRAWFTDPSQLFALKDGNYQTDMFSLAKTIDYIMNGNMSGTTHRFSGIVYRSTAPNPDDRYDNIDRMLRDIESVAQRPIYESSEEIVRKIILNHKRTKSFNYAEVMALLSKDTEGTLMSKLIFELGTDMIIPFCKISDLAFDVALKEISKVNNIIQSSYQNWNDYDNAAYWAIGVIQKLNKNHEVCMQAALITEYVADSVNRFNIKSASNKLKNNAKIDGHIRARLSYHEGY